ncbi:[protein-PII] uridylyltransferase [Cognatiluteimonas weifangensis]|uniref:Bifunctional uridylyltransferase/uridylyl-removing enzyme n=1 Tax=Cognatiluteimonas weifangensis TaxID=2303539 RepID=A0A372DRT0_9GAMM|nr:[protein-PII] uridylyltransferase [Luteimonas weifangensis]RFP62255.1 [protein-PII] uridylyltransferase [Luteimonas weifangensis]
MSTPAAADEPSARLPEWQPAGADAGWAAAARAALAATDAALAARFDRNDDIDALIAERTRAVDAWVRAAWSRCIPADAPLALFAVGGYGRGELFPHSDLDLLVLAEADAQAACHEAIARLFALLWDAGLAAGHAVRSPAQCTQAAREDITVLTALSEARPLQADAAADARLRAAIAPTLAWPPREYFLAKREEQRARHARFDDTSDNLEPNLKEGPGGLRDVQTLRWMALRVLGARGLQPLVALGQLGADEYATLERERRLLSRLRYGLHLVAGKREERLRFDYQKALAARLGHVDAAGSLAVEQMMQGFYRSAALVLRINERLLQRFEEQLEGEAVPEPLAAGYDARRGYLHATDPGWPRGVEDVFALLAVWAAHPQLRGLHSQTARALAEALPRLPDYPRADATVRARFMALLRGPQPVETLARMARLGVLGRWIPAFSRVSGRMQFDLFHVYTVDQHTLAVLRNIAGFAGGVADPRFAIAHEIWPRLRKPELLLLAGLFHDIAKGRGGDHSELGAVDARDFCAAHGLSEGDTALVQWLVRQHLLMSVTAQKQDIGDSDVIHRFATRVADRERLDLLYLLTCADIAGTSPKLWNAWKDRLLADLYTATRLALRRGLEHPPAAAERVAETRAAVRAQLLAQGLEAAEIERLFARIPETGFLRGRVDSLAWQAAALRGIEAGASTVRARPLVQHAGALEVFVSAPDRDGLFAAIVATLDRLGLAIQQARLLDGPGGQVFDSFEVVPADGQRIVAADEVERRLSAALAIADLDGIRPARRTQPRHLRHFRLVPQIGFGLSADGRRTVLSLVSTDRPGLLADVTRVLRRQRLRVHDARIATFGERAEDVFQITDERDRPLADPQQQQALRDALLACLEGEQRP